MRIESRIQHQLSGFKLLSIADLEGQFKGILLTEGLSLSKEAIYNWSIRRAFQVFSSFFCARQMSAFATALKSSEVKTQMLYGMGITLTPQHTSHMESNHTYREAYITGTRGSERRFRQERGCC